MGKRRITTIIKWSALPWACSFEHLAIWAPDCVPGLGNSSRPLSLSFHLQREEHFPFSKIGNKAAGRSKDLLMQSMTDRRTLDRSEWENWPDISQKYLQRTYLGTCHANRLLTHGSTWNETYFVVFLSPLRYMQWPTGIDIQSAYLRNASQDAKATSNDVCSTLFSP